MNMGSMAQVDTSAETLKTRKKAQTERPCVCASLASIGHTAKSRPLHVAMSAPLRICRSSSRVLLMAFSAFKTSGSAPIVSAASASAPIATCALRPTISTFASFCSSESDSDEDCEVSASEEPSSSTSPTPVRWRSLCTRASRATASITSASPVNMVRGFADLSIIQSIVVPMIISMPTTTGKATTMPANSMPPTRSIEPKL
mmetsp:Transcript_21485/g.45766  ORF Transcript_21485/g.45766 Transcript_21485/m.45766 type:complete len:202 (+) Transcript_21485:210-815(+)